MFNSAFIHYMWVIWQLYPGHRSHNLIFLYLNVSSQEPEFWCTLNFSTLVFAI